MARNLLDLLADRTLFAADLELTYYFLVSPEPSGPEGQVINVYCAAKAEGPAVSGFTVSGLVAEIRQSFGVTDVSVCDVCPWNASSGGGHAATLFADCKSVLGIYILVCPIYIYIYT